MFKKPSYADLEQRVHEFEKADSERVRAETALKEKEQFLKDVLRASSIGIAYIKDRKIVWANEAMEQLFGYESEEEYLEMDIANLFAKKKDYDRVNQMLFEKNRDEKIQDYDTIWVRKDGTFFDGYVRVNLIDVDDVQKSVVTSIVHITARKRVEKALRESELRYRDLLSRLPIGVYRNTPGQAGRFILANQAIAEMFGYKSPEQFLQTNVSDLYMDPAQRKSFSRKLLEQGGVDAAVLNLKRKDESPFLASVTARVVRNNQGEIKYFDGIIEDITERRQAENELRQSEERLKAIFEANPDPVVVYDVNGHPLYLNIAFTEVFGWSLNELQGKRIPFVPKDQEKISKAKIKEIYQSGKSVRFETKRLTRDNEILNVFLSAAIIDDIQGIHNGLVVNLKDITEQKKIEDMLRQSQKMEAIGTLAGGIAHDFNNILSGIFGYSQLTEMNIENPEKAKKYLKQVVKGAQRANELVQQILMFSRQAEHQKQPLELFLIVKEAIKLLRSSIPATIKIQQKISSQATVMADPTQAHQVVLNLCTNAYHAMLDSGGTLFVTLEDFEMTQNDHAVTNSINPGNYIRLEVKDTGHGMDKKTLEKIFDPYFTTKEADRGTGMGLSVVDGIVKKHNGFIRTYSEVGHGSIFQVFWPKMDKKRIHSHLEKKEIELPKGIEQIMLVDDESDILVTTKEILEKQGYKIVTFRNGMTALQAFTENPDFFDLVITDMGMPKMSGESLSKAILKIRSDIPIIMCTGYSHLIDEEKSKKLGISAYVMKPVDMDEMAKLIRRLLDY